MSLVTRLQLLLEFSRGRHFEGWQEGLITFSPTYKYQPNSDQYYWCFDSARSEKKRAPAWLALHSFLFREDLFGKKKLSFQEPAKKKQAKPWCTESCKWAWVFWVVNHECDLRLIEVLTFVRCDRILWRGKGLKQVQYETCRYRLSDHRPVRAVFHAECDVLSEGMVQK